MERWHWIAAGGALLIGGALVFKREADAPVDVDGTGAKLAVKTGAPLTSEQARAQLLIPAAQSALQSLQDALVAEYGLATYIGSTRRNPDEQAKIVAKGNSATHHSWHLLGRAVDLYPYGDDGKPDMAGKRVDLFRTMHEVAPRFGWSGLAFNPDGSLRKITTTKGGKQVKIWDGGHLQYTEGMSFAQASAAKGPLA